MPEPANILVADDDPGLRESLERTLAREGYRVVVASDGQAALERLQGGDCHGLVGFVVEPCHAPTLMVVARRAEEERDRAALRASRGGEE